MAVAASQTRIPLLESGATGDFASQARSNGLQLALVGGVVPLGLLQSRIAQGSDISSARTDPGHRGGGGHEVGREEYHNFILILRTYFRKRLISWTV